MTAVRLALLGGVGGLAWSAALRAYMAELVGFESRVDWVATFAQILLPGVVVGVLLGIAEHLRRTGGRRGWRWLAAAPALFALAPQFTPGAFLEVLTTGIGGGPFAVALIAMLGGFALSGRGPLWGRILAAVPALALTVLGMVAFFGFDRLSVGDPVPRGAWVGVLFASLSLVLAIACSIPHRPVVTATITTA